MKVFNSKKGSMTMYLMPNVVQHFYQFAGRTITLEKLILLLIDARSLRKGDE